MKISIHALGTRGDIQPYVALALGLMAEGHSVQIAAPSQYESFIAMRGIRFAHLPGEFLDLMDSPEGRTAMAGGGGFAAGFRMLKQFRPIGRKQLTLEWKAAQQFTPELIIYHPKAIAAPHIAEKLSCPAVLASPLPGFTPTSEFASPMVPFRSVGPFNRLTHSVMSGGGEAIFRSMIRDWRQKELGLKVHASRKGEPEATLYAYSEAVLPRPRDWPDNVAVTGYWVLDDSPDWKPDPSLQSFLDGDAEAPVYVGFGSMPGLDPQHLTNVVIEALRAARKRGVLATGGGALQEVPDASDMHFIAGAPHDRLFPLMAACVHHGGAGTTGASLRAGRPTIICPFFGDQPFWARRLQELGAAPASIEARKLSAEWLGAAIVEATHNERIQESVMRLREKLREEDGVKNAIAFLKERRLLAPADAFNASTLAAQPGP